MSNLLNIPLPENSSFSTDIPLLQTVWDSVSLGALKECPYKYYLSVVLGHTWTKAPVYLTWGIHMHKAFEYFAHAQAKGMSLDDSLVSAIELILADMVDFDHEDSPRNTSRTRMTLIRALVWYYDFYKDEPETVILANGKPAVELSFKLPLGLKAPDGEEYFLAGHIDRMVNFLGRKFILDWKSSSGALNAKFFDNFRNDNQVSLYDFAGQIIESDIKGVLIQGIQTQVNSARFHRAEIGKSKEAREVWFADFQQWLKLAEHFAETEHYPKNDKSCNNYAGCQYKEICSGSPLLIERKLKKEFKIDPWNPLDNR